jgi:hypothetical protein
MINVEMVSTLTMPDGSLRTITIKIHDLRQDSDDLWSVAVDVEGFKTDDHVRIKGCDWLNAIEGATLFIRGLAGGKVQDYGATIVPHIVPPERAVPTEGEHAQAISEGIKCLENLRKLAKADSQPPPESMLELNAMTRALQDVREGATGTDFVPDDALIADVREIFGWVGDWFTTGRISPTLIPRIEGILGKMGVDLNVLDSSS